MHFASIDDLDLHKNEEYSEEYVARNYDYPQPVCVIPKSISFVRYEY